MEIGSLAEWVAGIAETLAVTVALFLPYYQKRKSDQNSNQRAKQIIATTTTHLLHQNNIQDNNSYLELKRFVEIYSVLATNERTIRIISQGDFILSIIDNSNNLGNTQIKRISEILNSLKELKS
ncbi:hypothetical protein [Companilactobacillus baiquanensis]|uniref:Uncharacterized protein n=1 Tax=Companilactobacillus baiquanensis TaxID=2486005 RepID=A0ABW1UWV0_9LACO|nr:hypothetical protein [Companilactobacillus baiquanensis]